MLIVLAATLLVNASNPAAVQPLGVAIGNLSQAESVNTLEVYDLDSVVVVEYGEGWGLAASDDNVTLALRSTWVELLLPTGELVTAEIQAGGAQRVKGTRLYLYNSPSSLIQYYTSGKANGQMNFLAPCPDQGPPTAQYNGSWNLAYSGDCWSFSEGMDVEQGHVIEIYTCDLSDSESNCTVRVTQGAQTTPYSKPCNSPNFQVTYNSQQSSLTICM